MVQLNTKSIAEAPQFDSEPKAVLKTIMEHYKDSDLSNVTIPTDRLPEVLASLVSAFNMEELEQVIEAVDKEGSGKLTLPQTSQVLIFFLKKQQETKNFSPKVALKISTQMFIDQETAVVIVYFYPQIIKAVDDGYCALQ